MFENFGDTPKSIQKIVDFGFRISCYHRPPMFKTPAVAFFRLKKLVRVDRGWTKVKKYKEVGF